MLDFAEELISSLVGLPTLFIVGAAHRSEQPEELPAAGHFPAFEMGIKQLSAVLCGAALTPLTSTTIKPRSSFGPTRTAASNPSVGVMYKLTACTT